MEKQKLITLPELHKKLLAEGNYLHNTSEETGWEYWYEKEVPAKWEYQVKPEEGTCQKYSRETGEPIGEVIEFEKVSNPIWRVVRFRTSCAQEDFNWEVLPNLSAIREHILGIDTVYAVDINSFVRLCELTPSYELYRLYDELVISENCPNDIWDNIHNSTDDEVNDLENPIDVEEISYIHSSDFEGKINNGSMRIVNVEDYIDIDKDDDDLEEIREYFNGNRVI